MTAHTNADLLKIRSNLDALAADGEVLVEAALRAGEDIVVHDPPLRLVFHADPEVANDVITPARSISSAWEVDDDGDSGVSADVLVFHGSDPRLTAPLVRGAGVGGTDPPAQCHHDAPIVRGDGTIFTAFLICAPIAAVAWYGLLRFGTWLLSLTTN